MPTPPKSKRPGAKRKRPRPPVTPSPQAPDAAPAVATGTTRSARRRRPRRLRKPVRIGDALRREGVDERTIAETYAGEIVELKEKKHKDGGIKKLLFDMLKECSRHLESSRPTERSGAGDTPVTVQLVHVVPRPERPVTEEEKVVAGRS